MIKRLAKKRVRVIPGRNEGQSLVLFAIMIPVFIVFAAFVVDGAHAFVDRNRGFAQT
jgi:Flp pilus assembly protein TadG